MAEIRISFLGGIRIEHAGREVGDVVPRKLIALLGLLSAEAGRTAAVARVYRLLWPEVGEQRSRKSLNQLLVRGRRVLPGAIARPDEQLLSLGEGVGSDVWDLLFGSSLAAGLPPSRAAFEFLPGYSVGGCPELNDSLDAIRAQVRLRAARLALERARAVAPGEAHAWAVLAYGLDRADERAAAAYIRAVGAVQGPAAAWSAFTAHRRWLAEELDMIPSSGLTAVAADACRQASPLPLSRRSDAVPALAVASSGEADTPVAVLPDRTATSAEVLAAAAVPADAVASSVDVPSGGGPGRRRSGGPAVLRIAAGAGSWLGVMAALSVLTVLSVLAWRQLRTPGAAAGTPSAVLVVSTPLAGAALGDSALQLAVAHLAQHGVRADLLPTTSRGGGGMRVLLPGWRGAAPAELSVGPQAWPTVGGLAAALVDSTLGVLRRRDLATTLPGSRAARTDPLLRKADSALATAKALVATGGSRAALLMLESADSLAARASRAHPADWEPYLARADIANQVFWYRLATGSVDPAELHSGLALADAAIERGGGLEALKTRAALSFSVWVFGSPGAEAAGGAARRDYAAVVTAAPGDGEAWSRLAQLYHADGRLSDAYAAALQAVPALAGPARLDAFMELFLAALDRQDNPTARRWCSEIGFHHPDSWFGSACAAMYAWADSSSPMPDAASVHLQEPAELRQSLEHQLALLRAGADLARGNYSAAAPKIASVQPWIQGDPQLASIWVGVLVELGKHESALSALHTYLGDVPSRRLIVGRPWLRPLYRPGESWQQFLARVAADTGADTHGAVSHSPAGRPARVPLPRTHEVISD